MLPTHIKKRVIKNLCHLALSAALITPLAGCYSLGTVSDIVPGMKSQQTGKSSSKLRVKPAAPRMGVNEYLWRASLETLDFMPLTEIDPFGGVIITDWFANPEAPNERFKATVYILDTNLRADALKVSIFKQERSQNGWQDASVDADTGRYIENSILTRARQLYIATVDN